MATKTTETAIAIQPLKFEIAEFCLIGTAPLVINKFSEKARNMILAKHIAGSTAKKGIAREAKSVDDAFNGARHISEEGWDGISAAAFRNAAISACRLVGYKMTLAKLSVFIEPDGFSADDASPLVRIIGQPPRAYIAATRNATGVVDVRIRPQWRRWGLRLRVRYDATQFTTIDITNLFQRVGAQVGIGEGRPDSKSSAGMGFGTFRFGAEEEIAALEAAEKAAA